MSRRNIRMELCVDKDNLVDLKQVIRQYLNRQNKPKAYFIGCKKHQGHFPVHLCGFSIANYVQINTTQGVIECVEIYYEYEYITRLLMFEDCRSILMSAVTDKKLKLLSEVLLTVIQASQFVLKINTQTILQSSYLQSDASDVDLFEALFELLWEFSAVFDIGVSTGYDATVLMCDNASILSTNKFPESTGVVTLAYNKDFHNTINYENKVAWYALHVPKGARKIILNAETYYLQLLYAYNYNINKGKRITPYF